MAGLIAAGFTRFSAGVAGDGKVVLATLTALESLFSCELPGSTASLLGTGVMVTGRLVAGMELDLVVSVRHGKRVSFLDAEECWRDGMAPEDEFGVVPAALEKKPRILCCFPVEDPVWFEADRAGVRATEPLLPAILLPSTVG
jgi:hypothetical protein